MTATAPQVPADVIANVQQRWPERVDIWASYVDTELRELCDRYDATPRRVLPARYGFVIAADTPAGPIVLRSSPDPHGPEQAAVATTLAKLDLAPTVHETITTDHGTWAVLDQVQPGTPLADADPATVSLESLFAPLAAMSGQPAPMPYMPSIVDWLRDRLEDDRLTDLRPGAAIAPAKERRAALDVLDQLARDLLPSLCHGDAQPGNILAGGPHRWKLIDPRGMAGESAYDVAVLAAKIALHEPSEALVARVSELADVDAKRVIAWIAVANAARV